MMGSFILVGRWQQITVEPSDPRVRRHPFVLATFWAKASFPSEDLPKFPKGRTRGAGKIQSNSSLGTMATLFKGNSETW
jgi:hypothetical protein